MAPAPSPAGDDVPVYVISVAAQLAGMHPQTLRQYDRLGLVSPGRTPSGGRRYSARNVTQLREVQKLSAAGVSLEGVRRVLELEDHVAALQARVAQVQADLAVAVEALRRVGRDLPAVRHDTGSTALVLWRSPQR